MTLQFSTALRTNMVAQIQATAGSTGVTLNIFTGAVPANCAAAATGTLLASIPLPPVFLTSANGAATIANGPWTANAIAAGIAGYFRLTDANGNTVQQGDCITDLVLQNTNIAVGQAVIAASYSITNGNA